MGLSCHGLLQTWGTHVARRSLAAARNVNWSYNSTNCVTEQLATVSRVASLECCWPDETSVKTFASLLVSRVAGLERCWPHCHICGTLRYYTHSRIGR